MNRRNTPRGQMSMGKGGPAIQMMEGAMRAMFEPPPPLEFKKSICKRKPPTVEGVAAMLKGKGAANIFEKGAPPPPEKFETPRQKHARIAAAKKKTDEEGLKDKISKWTPKDDPKAKGDAYKTLFIAKISYDTTEKKLRREFEQFGRIQSIRLVQDEDGKPRGYAFVEYENEDDMRVAYKRGDGRKIDGRRVLVDVERGRTVRNWLPRRFGGGLETPARSARRRAMRPSGASASAWQRRPRRPRRRRGARRSGRRRGPAGTGRGRSGKRAGPRARTGTGDGKRSDSRERGRRGDSRDRSRSRDGSRDRRRRSRSRDRRR